MLMCRKREHPLVKMDQVVEAEKEAKLKSVISIVRKIIQSNKNELNCLYYYSLRTKRPHPKSLASVDEVWA